MSKIKQWDWLVSGDEGLGKLFPSKKKALNYAKWWRQQQGGRARVAKRKGLSDIDIRKQIFKQKKSSATIRVGR